MKKLLVIAAVLFSTTAVIQAQTEPAARINEWKLYGGYQYTALDTHSVQDALNLQHLVNPGFPQLKVGNRQHLDGWDLGIQNDITKWFGVVLDVAGTYKETRLLLSSSGGVNVSTRTKMAFYTFTGGPQFTFYRGTHVQPFARALIGGSFFRSRTDLVANNVSIMRPVSFDDQAFAGGGGLGSDFFFSRRFGLRFAADWFRTALLNETQNQFRGTGALVFRF
jgi:hypothetical protein